MSYSAKNIQILEGLEAVRKRPGMYIGSTNSRGLHHLIWEVVDNSIDEHLGGHCSYIILNINKDGSISVEDNGRGIPVDLHQKGVAAERIIMTTLHAGGKFNNDGYKVSGGLHGVGASVVNALSSKVIVEIYSNGSIHYDEYKDGGVPVVKLKNGLLPIKGNTTKRGTKITFYPDETIFETVQFKSDIIKKKLKEVAFLNKNLTIELNDFTLEQTEQTIFHEEKGIIGMIESLNNEKELITENVIYIEGEQDETYVEVAFQYSNDFNENVFSFCNNINTQEGGTHVTGFKTALTKTINKYVKDLNLIKGKDSVLDGKDIRSGLNAVISIKYKTPQFEGQTKTKLGNSDVKTIVEEFTGKQLELFFDRNMEVLKKIIENAVRSFNLRKTEAKVRDNFIKDSTSINRNLSDSQEKLDYKKGVLTEIFLVEGESAGGSAKQGRSRKTQAILPLKGKVLNVNKKPSIDKILSNKEIMSLISALGCGFGEGYGNDFDITKLRYDKIIILTDADTDGAHIRTLLFTFFYKYMIDLILNGKVYIGLSPLYKIAKKDKFYYALDEKELNQILDKIGREGISIQRFKGLGEMNPEQLWDTTMNPETRKLKQLKIEDLVNAEEKTNVLMGDDTKKRKILINNNLK